jgi:alpha-tubulin suppressor-like RCC1 family protein
MPEYKYYTVCNKLALSGGKMVGSLLPPPPIYELMSLSASRYYSLLSDSTNQTWGWGFNQYGTIGDNSTTNQCTPVSIHGDKKTFCKISGDGYHSLGIDYQGQVWGWGANGGGQLGNNSTVQKLTPVSIHGAKKTFCHIGGAFHSLGIDYQGQVWAWGTNSFGRLGDNSTADKCIPVSIHGAKKTFCHISGGYHALGIDRLGQVWGWGYNLQGQLGDNSTTSKCTPISIHGAKKTFCHISVGFYHSLGIDYQGQVWSWSYNLYGQLGDNTTISRRTPVSIHGNKKTFCHISVGNQYSSFAIDHQGQVWSWGNNQYGRLGDNSITSKRTPVSIHGIKKTFCHISGGWDHSMAIDYKGQVWSWSRNVQGQLGDNSTTSKRTPVRVCNF